MSVILIFLYLIWRIIKYIRVTVPNETYTNNTLKQSTNNEKFMLKCTKCGAALKVTDKFCGSCGEAFDGDNVIVEALNADDKEIVTNKNFDSIFNLGDDLMLETFIEKEMFKAKIDEKTKLVPSPVLKRKTVFNIIFSILLFVYVSLIFFHFPILTYIIGAFILFIFFRSTRKFTLMIYMKKQIKSRPSEKISNVIMSIKSTFTEDKSGKQLLIGNIIAITLSLLVFIKPIILYEKNSVWDGYAVRFYAFGVTNFTTATIPETHNNKKVVSLRGNTFSNMPFLREVKLPNTIIEIRGQAFKNDRKLQKVNIPNNLFYLGGGAFYNCTSIESIQLPDTLIYMGGETFKNAKSLVSINLPNRLEEIRGNTFENCTSLSKINIPDSVTRIGGHAFYGNSSLSEVRISPNSKLNEIGSSAFRRCDSLIAITIPRETNVNRRAFKESPTQIYHYSESENSWGN